MENLCFARANPNRRLIDFGSRKSSEYSIGPHWMPRFLHRCLTLRFQSNCTLAASFIPSAVVIRVPHTSDILNANFEMASCWYLSLGSCLPCLGLAAGSNKIGWWIIRLLTAFFELTDSKTILSLRLGTHPSFSEMVPKCQPFPLRIILRCSLRLRTTAVTAGCPCYCNGHACVQIIFLSVWSRHCSPGSRRCRDVLQCAYVRALLSIVQV